MSKDYDDNENDDIFRKEQVEKFYAEARPLREKYKPRELTNEELTKDTECKYCKQGCFRCDARKTLTDQEIIEISHKALEQSSFTKETNFMVVFARAIIKASRGEK